MRRAATITVSALVTVGSPLAAPASAANAGPPTTGGEPIPLDGVEEIVIDGSGHATVTIGSPAELSISGPPEAVDQLAVTVDDDELTIEPGPEDGAELAAAGEVRYEIVVERVADIDLRGNVSLEIDGVDGTDLGLDLSDSTSASVTNVEAEQLDVEVRGTALLVVSGTAGELEVDARESGAFDGSELAAGTADVDARESARVVVNVSTLLEVEAGGTAIVEHVGTPAQTEFDLQDSGQVRPATGTLLPTVPAAGSVHTTTPVASPAAGPESTSTSGPATFEVRLAGRAFSPAVLEVAVGDTVTWINDDDTEHTVTAFDGAFDSGELAEGATFSFTFDTAGEFDYRCLFHSEMQATVIVR